ncbi:MAG: polyprenyl synthetase family protein, partial [Bacteroidia bacterium]|nr:polyprenyl synthetase family protein [Bacteroidia bacterium]
MFAISDLNKYIENSLANLNLKQEPKDLYEPIEYMISIGGKRIRPLLCLTTYNLFSDRIEKFILNPA